MSEEAKPLVPRPKSVSLRRVSPSSLIGARPMYTEGYISFVQAASEVQGKLGCSGAVAKKRLRQASKDELLRTMKAPYRIHQGWQLEYMPQEFWKRVPPSEWHQRQVDYDNDEPDADGNNLQVMIDEEDFRSWLLDQPQPEGQPVKGQGRAARKRDVARNVIKERWPEGIPDGLPNPQIAKEVGELIQQRHKKLVVSHDTILRAAGRKK
jgi:hypothetical protein